ncbi:MAG: IS110 family transposase [Gemmatimonadales bacterium]|nr:MAG: IS110 family transposase [Gemmatimonadales bacterium]
METKLSDVRFDGQEFNLGIDVHHRSWKVTIRTAGMEVKTMAMPPDPRGLHTYMTKHYPGGTYNSAYEAGFSGFWAHRQLVELGIANSVVHAADVPTTDKERRQKDDPRDSRKLARGLENAELNAIHIPSPATEQLRSLCRLRERISSHIVRLKNRIKGFLKYYGMTVEEDSAYRHWSGAFLTRLEGLCSEPGPRSDTLLLTLEALREESRRMATITQKLRQHCREGEAARIIALLKTVPGIGPKTAFMLYTELQDIGRFANLDKLNSFLGLIPSTESSGEDEKATGITPRCNRALRPLLIEAAWVAIRCDTELLKAFSKLASRMKKQAAIMRIARKLAARVAYVWRTGTPYKPVVPIG